MPYFMTLVSLFASDSAIKLYIEKKKNADEETPALGGRIRVRKYHNHGAMMDACRHNPRLAALLSLAFSAFVTGMFAATFGKKGKGLLNTGLALILGGAYSNTYDRLRRGYVVDYFSFNIGAGKRRSKILREAVRRWNAIVFNLSDFGIIIGAALFAISELTKTE